jgi:hypothetical protein
MLGFVPLVDDFGDWATPKKSRAGHFFVLMRYNEATGSETGGFLCFFTLTPG